MSHLDLAGYRLGKSWYAHMQMAAMLASGHIRGATVAGMAEIAEGVTVVIFYDLSEQDVKDLIAWRLRMLMARNDRHVHGL